MCVQLALNDGGFHIILLAVPQVWNCFVVDKACFAFMDSREGIFEIREYIDSSGNVEKSDVRDISAELEYFSKLCAEQGQLGDEMHNVRLQRVACRPHGSFILIF